MSTTSNTFDPKTHTVPVRCLDGTLRYIRKVPVDVNCIALGFLVFIRGGGKEFNEVAPYKARMMHTTEEPETILGDSK